VHPSERAWASGTVRTGAVARLANAAEPIAFRGYPLRRALAYRQSLAADLLAFRRTRELALRRRRRAVSYLTLFSFPLRRVTETTGIEYYVSPSFEADIDRIHCAFHSQSIECAHCAYHARLHVHVLERVCLAAHDRLGPALASRSWFVQRRRPSWRRQSQ
jgi:hypothetical protein